MLSRRNALALTAVFTVAALATGDAGAALTTRSFVAGSFVLDVDGKSQVFVSGIDGGAMVMEAQTEPGAHGAFVKKRPSPPKFDPLELQISPANLSSPLVTWLMGSGASGPTPAANASIAVLDGTFKETSRRAFRNLRVSEVTFPELDAASKDAGNISVEAIAEGVTEAKGSGATSTIPTTKNLRWTSSAFTVTVPGVDASRVSKVSPITVKFPAAGKGDVSTFTVTLSEASAESWKKWHADTMAKGASASDGLEKTVTIDYLPPTLKGSVLKLTLEGVGILSVLPADSGADTVRRVKAELYAESIRVEPGRP